MDLTMTVKEVAEKLGKSQEFVREGLARGLLPFGTGFSVKENGKRRTFLISRKKFEEYMGNLSKNEKNNKSVGN